MPSIILPETIYLLTQSDNKEKVVLLEDKRQPGRMAILFFLDKELAKVFRGGEYTKEEYLLFEMSTLEAEETVKCAKEDGIEALILLYDPERKEAFRMGILTQIGGRIAVGQA